MNIQAEKIRLAKLVLETDNETVLSKIKEIFLSDKSDLDIPEWHKEIVLGRVAEAKPEDYIPWDKAKKKLTHK